MQGRHEYQPELFNIIDYENLIPKNHLLRKIDKVLNLDFIYGLTKDLYAEGKGRPSIDPELFLRMTLLSYLYNIESDRRLCEEIGFNLAYRWFCRLSLNDKVPDHSSMTKIRDRLGESVYENIFLEVVEQCKKAGLVKAEQVMADGSSIQANASMYKMVLRDEEHKIENDEIDKGIGIKINASKDGLSNNDLRKNSITGQKITNRTHYCPTDPEATLSGKSGEYKRLNYKTHNIIDAESRVVIDCHVTTGAVNEIKKIVERVEATEKNINLKIKELVADRGYGSGEVLGELSEKGIETNVPLWSSRSGKTFMESLDDGFVLNDEEVICPAGHQMKKARTCKTTGQHYYYLGRKTCITCPMAKTCLKPHEIKSRGKIFLVPKYHKEYLEVKEKQQTEEFKYKLRERMWKIEGIFGEAKSHHGLRRAKYRGRSKVQIQVYMISTVQNLKRLANSVIFWFKSIILDLIKNQKTADIF